MSGGTRPARSHADNPRHRRPPIPVARRTRAGRSGPAARGDARRGLQEAQEARCRERSGGAEREDRRPAVAPLQCGQTRRLVHHRAARPEQSRRRGRRRAAAVRGGSRLGRPAAVGLRRVGAAVDGRRYRCRDRDCRPGRRWREARGAGARLRRRRSAPAGCPRRQPGRCARGQRCERRYAAAGGDPQSRGDCGCRLGPRYRAGQ